MVLFYRKNVTVQRILSWRLLGTAALEESLARKQDEHSGSDLLVEVAVELGSGPGWFDQDAWVLCCR